MRYLYKLYFNTIFLKMSTRKAQSSEKNGYRMVDDLAPWQGLCLGATMVFLGEDRWQPRSSAWGTPLAQPDLQAYCWPPSELEGLCTFLGLADQCNLVPSSTYDRFRLWANHVHQRIWLSWADQLFGPRPSHCVDAPTPGEVLYHNQPREDQGRHPY